MLIEAVEKKKKTTRESKLSYNPLHFFHTLLNVWGETQINIKQLSLILGERNQDSFVPNTCQELYMCRFVFLKSTT